MNFKTITVCLNEIAANPKLLDVVRKLGVRFDAHIKGLYVIPAVQIYGGAAPAMVPVVFDANRVHFESQLPKVREAFETIMKKDGLNFDLQVVDSDVTDMASDIITNARASDLIVVAGHVDPGNYGIESEFVERLIIGAGRPVLVVPAKGKGQMNLDEVMVAWDGGRESTRAVFDALPLIEGAKKLHVVSVNSTLDGMVPGASLAEVLDRHGFKTEVVKVSSDGMNTGEALLRAANDYGVGLIVMGCYGHGRFSEFVFGGATRHMLANLDRPVLMSH